MTRLLATRAAPILVGAVIAFAALSGAGFISFVELSPQAAVGLAIGAAGLLAVVYDMRTRREQAERFEDAAMKLAGEIERAGAHLAALDERVRDLEQWIAGQERPGADQWAADIETLGSLVKELAVTVAQHDAELVANTAGDGRSAATPAAAGDMRRIAVERAIAEGAFDLHLQPIVSLPQRRVKYYEAFPRLRLGEGAQEPASEALAAAPPDRRPEADVGALRRLAIAARRLVARNRDIATLLAVADETAAAPDKLIEALQGLRDLAGHVVIVVSQTAARSEHFKRLKPVHELGFALGLNRIVDLRFDARALFEHGVRYVTIPAPALIAPGGRAPAEIHPQDMAKYLARNGIQLIASDIDAEGTAVEALDLDVRFGQGAAFSAPRPLKPELLEPPAGPVAPTTPPANDAPPRPVSYRSTLKRA